MSSTNSTMTQDVLKKFLEYDENTGIFTRKITTSHNAKKGDIAGTRNKKGYLVISVNNKRYYAHRLAWLYLFGEFPKNLIDHIDGNPLNNRICNLRDVLEFENHQNLKKAKKNNKSGFMGVVHHQKRWRAALSVNGKYKYLGMFDTPELAHEAYLKAKRKYHIGCTI